MIEKGDSGAKIQIAWGGSGNLMLATYLWQSHASFRCTSMCGWGAQASLSLISYILQFTRCMSGRPTIRALSRDTVMPIILGLFVSV